MVVAVIMQSLYKIRENGSAALGKQQLKRKANRPFGTDVVGFLDVIKTLQGNIDRLFADAKYASEAAADGNRPGVVAVCLPVGGNDR